MRVIGIKPAKDRIDWVVVEGSRMEPDLLNAGVLKQPRGYLPPEWLAWLRSQLVLTLDEEAPDLAAIVGIEGNARATHALFPRLHAEAVAMETCATKGVTPCHSTWPAVSAALDVSRSKREYAKADEFRGIATSGLKPGQLDALHAATASLPEVR